VWIPKAEGAAAGGLSLPMNAWLKADDMERIVEAVCGA